MTEPPLRRELGLRDLVLFNVAAVVGIRWLAAAARAGPGSLALWISAAAFFFVPSALAVARLSARCPQEGGIYVWARREFGAWHGFLCGWCYWLSNLFYFPNLLLAGLSMAAYSFAPEGRLLSENRAFLVVGAWLLLWLATLTNLIGVRVGKWTENLGAAAAYAAGLLLVVGAALVAFHRGPATRLDAPWPRWDWNTVNFWSQIAFAFGGLELGAVMGGEIRDPHRTVPRAAVWSGLAIAVFYLAGTAAILMVLRPEQVSILSGLAQAAAAIAEAAGFEWFGPLVGGLIVVGITGQLGAWMAASARVPFVIGLDRYLPPAFARLHPRWGTPHVAMLGQAAACSLLLLVMQLGETVRAGYQLLVDLTVIAYFLPFGYLFLAAARQGLGWSSRSGIAVTALAILVSLVPPAETRSPWWFEVKLLAGCALLVGAARMVYQRAARK